jgi:hypothetical protein
MTATAERILLWPEFKKQERRTLTRKAYPSSAIELFIHQKLKIQPNACAFLTAQRLYQVKAVNSIQSGNT